MTLHKLLAVAACALLLTACEDDNDQRIAAYKKCQAAGMDSVEYIGAWGIQIRCIAPRAKP